MAIEAPICHGSNRCDMDEKLMTRFVGTSGSLGRCFAIVR
jgi:hypothetical protein